MDHLVLSDADEAAPQSLRGGALVVKSPKGLRGSERLLVEALSKTSPGRFLSGFDAEGAVALAAARLWPEARVVWRHLDAYVASKVAENAKRNGLAGRVDVRAAPDLPGFTGRGGPADEPFDAIALPTSARGEALLTRELIEQSHDVLNVGGVLAAATGGDPTWLRDVMKDVFGKADASRDPRGGAVVRSTRTKDRAAWKEHGHVLTIDAGVRELKIETRPGTFSYGRLDRGTKALMKTLERGLAPTARVLDLGCGHGVLGLTALARAPKGRATLVDSNARAIDLAVRNAARNQLSSAEILLRADLEGLPPASFDLALANPPYFGDYRIARSFVRAARAALRKGGELRLVVKATDKHAEIVDARFDKVEVVMDGEYGIVVGRVL